MSEILTKARELGQAIVDSEEYKALKAAEEKQEKDEEAIALLVEYNNVRKALAEEIQSGEVSDERMAEIRSELEECYEKVMSNSVISEYHAAQQKFEAVVGQMNSILTYFMTGEISGGCSGNCSGCSSCG
ncbi:MAG: YlbF family regulator [Clostridia bacterium]|nr:YlbF family regulator [Clostridia bacterium]